MSSNNIYDVAIVGGGLAGLSLSIQLAKAGYKVVVFEKEKYPFHKVCGEYISLESWNFIESLGLDLKSMDLPIIKNLIVSSPKGKIIEQQLPLGGFGISRYLLDSQLSKIAKANGVDVLEEIKVSNIEFDNDFFSVAASGKTYQSKVVAATYGKRSNLDVKWNRDFTRKKNNKLNNYIGIKYHIKTDHPADTTALHNFKSGYCGISKIEEDKYSLCYLTTANNLRANNNSIAEMENNILFKNPFLKGIFLKSEFLFDAPVTISQISFDKKTLIEDHALMIGDAAGMITPLCGNGMSMAFHGSKIAFECITAFLQNNISRKKMEERYISTWNKNFAARLKRGRIIQSLFFREWLSNFSISILKPFPSVVHKLIKSTHGKPF